MDKKDFCEQKRLLRKTWNSKIKKQGLKMWLYWRKKRKKSFKKTENKLATENGKQKLKAMMDDIPTFHYIYMFL
jgi:hypothetical protein